MDYKATLDKLITSLVSQSGSDLHIASSRKPYIRVTGELVPISDEPEYTNDDTFGLLEILVGKSNLEKFKVDKEIDFSFSFRDSHRLRGNAFFQRGLVSIVLRLIPQAKTFTELNLPDILATFSRKQQGFFLVVGPVGQGKSTTMSAMVNLINEERAAHIVTIEDPIEFIYQPKKSIIDQREVGIDTKDFTTALRSVFREDVNVILIGEMRSPETIATAVTAAETGHLVIATLHTNNASQTIDRIIDSFPAGQQDQIRMQLAGSLLGIFSQRLIPRSAGGRVPAYELLINNTAVSNLIREKRTHEIDVIIETGFQQGMVDMNRSLADLVQRGEISVESAEQYSLNPNALKQLI